MTTELINNVDKISTEDNEPGTSPFKQSNEIGEAITRFLHSARDIKWSCRVFIPKAGNLMKSRYDDAKEHINKGEALLASSVAVERVHGIKQMQEAMRKVERLSYSRIPEVLETSLFLSLFSAFDVYTGELLSAVYKRKPELFGKLNRKVELVDVLTANSIEELKRSVLEEEIETFRRKSYVEQFAELESTFGLTLRAFDRWPEFVECAQRRNLLTHCGGIVSEQYLKICKTENYPEKDLPSVGEKLGLGGKYFLPRCELMIEVGLKLGQTLWRKVLPNEIAEADKHLHHTQYDALFSHNWDRAKVFGEFAVSQHKVSSEIEKRLSIINYCIALKFSGDEAGAQRALNKIDWSASTNDFRLAEAVLQDRFEDAAALMVKIGKSGEMVTEGAYHTWPLFHLFREKNEFMVAYEKVFGHPFAVELKRTADAALTEASTKANEIDVKSAEVTSAGTEICQ
ncbi:MAG: hypothetical protein ACYCY5_10050 [Sulfuricella sp.]